jgi:hypothetical protein
MIFNNGLWKIKESPNWANENGENSLESYSIRQEICICIAKIISDFYKTNVMQYKLTILQIQDNICGTKDDLPCAHYDRSIICIGSKGFLWCQFVHQFAHELCHCTTSRKQLPQKIKWFDEFLCCFTSYFVEHQIATNADYDLSFCYSKYKETFTEYKNSKQQEHIYDCLDTKSSFLTNRNNYEADGNLIKKHDYYYIDLFNKLDNNFNGLSIIGKIHAIQLKHDPLVEDLLSALFQIANEKEQEVLNIIIDIFGVSKNIKPLTNKIPP